jgi:hypothetical protein
MRKDETAHLILTRQPGCGWQVAKKKKSTDYQGRKNQKLMKIK